MDSRTQPPSTSRPRGGRDRDAPGVLVVFAAGQPAARGIALTEPSLELGRRDGSAGALDDARVSRRHARITLEDGRWRVTDLGSQNGTFVDGVRIAAHAPTEAQRVFRIGDTLLVPCSDVRPFEATGVRRIDGFLRGPEMQRVLAEAARAARSGTTLHVRGETGTGKEGIAQAFHRAGARAAGPFIAVNCAAIPAAIAERLLFGAKRGAFSGADADAAGHVQAADGGTLFLDEIAELDPQVQAKLLRVLESREVVPVGASRPRTVDIAVCSATHKDLRALVASGALRGDLYFRVGQPVVALPALRNRPEEIPALITAELARRTPPLAAHVSLVEQCLLRPWPGNVREIIAEIRAAADSATDDGDGDRVTADHLAPAAGSMLGDEMPAPAAADDRPQRRIPRVDDAWRRRIEEALRTHAGNVSAAARALGLHRTQLRRLIERHGIIAD